jgi:hypothetical protein
MRGSLISIVEGLSECESVPILIRRVLAEENLYDIDAAKPFRVKRNRIVKPGELEKALTAACATRMNPLAALVLIDADDDCPVELANGLRVRCEANLKIPYMVVIASREYESWLLGAKESLRGIRNIRPDANTVVNAESIRGAKERLSSNMIGSRYIETDDQPALTQKFDLELAAVNCPSFAKFRRDMKTVIEAIRE